jgi:spore coat protein A
MTGYMSARRSALPLLLIGVAAVLSVSLLQFASIADAQPAPANAVPLAANDPALTLWTEDALAGLPPLAVPDYTFGLAQYTITAVRCNHVYHANLGGTPSYGYANGTYADTPGPTLITQRNRPIGVRWVNDLPSGPDMNIFSIDPTVMGAPQDNSNRMVTHVHGLHVLPSSDGLPTQWFGPGKFRLDKYPNIQAASELWYHDHALGITRTNVYAGLAGLYFNRDSYENKLNTYAKLPMIGGINGAYEIPLVFQDKDFLVTRDAKQNITGSYLYYPSTWQPEFFASISVVNFKVWPHLDLQPRMYRFRILNATNSRFINMILPSNLLWIQIGAEGGFMPAPAYMGNTLLIAPAERADVLVDFSSMAGQSFILGNNAPAPYGAAPEEFPDPTVAHTMGQLMQINVGTGRAGGVPINMSKLRAGLPPVKNLGPSVPLYHYTKRKLLEEIFLADGVTVIPTLDGKRFADPVSRNEIEHLGSTAVWEIVNTTPDTHPMHIHLETFQVLGRQTFDTTTFEPYVTWPNPLNNTATGPLILTGAFQGPRPNETGLKDTVQCPEGMVTWIKIKWEDFIGTWVWHCHILEHEENDMMRPLEVGL